MYDYYAPREKPPDAEVALARLRKKNPDIKPVQVTGKLAKSWWAQAWNRNLESYADYENRIGRGRSYLRKGYVLDLQISPGLVQAQVQGSRATPYQVGIGIDYLDDSRWQGIVDRCSHSIANLDELAAGRFPQQLEELFTNRGEGLFPSPREIDLHCTCPDWAVMCKHVAAVLYGIGARFDDEPLLFFTLRNIDFGELLKKSVDQKMNSMLQNAGQVTNRVMQDVDTKVLFGV